MRPGFALEQAIAPKVEAPPHKGFVKEVVMAEGTSSDALMDDCSGGATWQPIAISEGHEHVGVTVDDHCLVVLVKAVDAWRPVTHIPEVALTLIQQLIAQSGHHSLLHGLGPAAIRSASSRSRA